MMLWRLMEDECHELDLELARLSRDQAGDRQGYVEYSRKVHEVNHLEEESEKAAGYVTMLDSACTVLVLRLGEAAPRTPLLQIYRQRLCAHIIICNPCCV